MRSPENVLESLKSKACNKSYKYERLYRNPVSYTHLDGKRRGKLRRQEIEIYYSFVGKVELPDT